MLSAKVVSNMNQAKEKIVLLVHGIRTHAPWYQEVRRELESHGYIVELTSYGRFDLFRFLAPISYFRSAAQEHLYRQIRIAKKMRPEAKFSVIAHSFGTYLLSNILKGEFDLKLDRIIFVGSVVKFDFKFEQFSHRYTENILNEASVRDVWPVAASSITFGYGSTGTFGFKRPGVYDRWHTGGHSAILNAEYCRCHWVPYLDQGTITEIGHKPLSPPIWVRILDIVKIKYIIILFVFLSALFYALVSLYGATERTYLLGTNGKSWTLAGNNRADTINKTINASCPLKSVFGKHCPNWLAKKITKRGWRKIQHFDSDLKSLSFTGNFSARVRDPIDFYYILEREYNNCLTVSIENDRYVLILASGRQCSNRDKSNCTCERK